ncbi:MAG: hypothetical protein EHM23_29240 [Acidobacteria bacterium]|nr:MAG: hypothetical protein EHM23_29240 [Acidobacteriota bacterium]
MVSTRVVMASMVWAVLLAPLIQAQDLSVYRQFQFGMRLVEVAKRAEVNPSVARVIHQRPALIEELEWRPQRSYDSSKETDPVREVLFSFYNGELFRVLVTYDQDKTQGLTYQDMVDSISGTYGTASRPDAQIILFSSSSVYNNTEKVIARWEDPQYSVNLFRVSYNSAFGVAAFSKRLDALAEKAIIEAIRLDAKEAPEREIQRQKQEDDANRLAEDKARPGNKANFRP